MARVADLNAEGARAFIESDTIKELAQKTNITLRAIGFAHASTASLDEAAAAYAQPDVAAGEAELLGAALASAPLWVASLRWTEDWPVSSMAVFAYTDSQAAEIGRRLLGSRRRRYESRRHRRNRRFFLLILRTISRQRVRILIARDPTHSFKI